MWTHVDRVVCTEGRAKFFFFLDLREAPQRTECYCKYIWLFPYVQVPLLTCVLTV